MWLWDLNQGQLRLCADSEKNEYQQCENMLETFNKEA